MNKTIREIFVGMLLGDGHIRRSGTNKAYIAFEQSTKKTEYFNFVKESLQKEGLDINKLQTYEREDSRYGGSVNNSIRFSTESSENFKPLADLFLDENGKKIIPKDIENHLTIKGLAY